MKLFQAPKKSLGQNFLVDTNIINKIVKIANITKNSTVLEIGPGYGNLTEKILLQNPKKITTVEKDNKLALFLKEKFISNKNVKVANKDILEVLGENNLSERNIVFGNLPYNISTKILASLILLKKWPPWYSILIFMFQKEVANRIIGKAKTKDFGRLSVLANWRFDIKKHFDISRNSFFPKPKVDSTLLSFVPKKNKYYLKNPKSLELITRILFSNRRKMINKNFYKLFNRKLQIEKKLNINLSNRPGDISNEMYYKIARYYETLID
jgi:16S rRNA (adenine1518-N6/adenine1519-N6)-dimethyltransferase